MTLHTPNYPGTRAYFIVPNLDEYHAQVVGRGAKIAEPPHGMPFGRTFSVQAPDGHRLGLYEA